MRERGRGDVTGPMDRAGGRGNTMSDILENRSTKFLLCYLPFSVCVGFGLLCAGLVHYRLAAHGVGTSCWPVLICCCWAPEVEAEPEEERILVLGSLWSFFHFMRRFWNQIFTWRSDRHMVCAISTRLRRVR